MKTIRIASSLKEFCCQKVKTFEIASGRHGVLRGFSNLVERERLMMQDGEGEISGTVFQKMRDHVISLLLSFSLSLPVYMCVTVYLEIISILRKSCKNITQIQILSFDHNLFMIRLSYLLCLIFHRNRYQHMCLYI